MNAQNKITASARKYFTAVEAAGQRVQAAALGMVLALLDAHFSGYIVDGTALDTAGILGGRENGKTAPLRSRIIGKSGILALVTEAGQDSIPALVEAHGEDVTRTLAAYLSGNVKVDAVRVALNLPDVVRASSTEATPTEAEQAEAGNVADSVADVTNTALLRMLGDVLAEVNGRTLTDRQRERVTDMLAGALAALDAEVTA